MSRFYAICLLVAIYPGQALSYDPCAQVTDFFQYQHCSAQNEVQASFQALRSRQAMWFRSLPPRYQQLARNVRDYMDQYYSENGDWPPGGRESLRDCASEVGAAGNQEIQFVRDTMNSIVKNDKIWKDLDNLSKETYNTSVNIFNSCYNWNSPAVCLQRDRERICPDDPDNPICLGF